MHFPMYIMVKAPRYMAVGTVSAFALTIVLGNMIQIAKFGPMAKSKGITPEPLYLLGAIRLAALKINTRRRCAMLVRYILHRLVSSLLHKRLTTSIISTQVSIQTEKKQRATPRIKCEWINVKG